MVYAVAAVAVVYIPSLVNPPSDVNFSSERLEKERAVEYIRTG